MSFLVRGSCLKFYRMLGFTKHVPDTKMIPLVGLVDVSITCFLVWASFEVMRNKCKEERFSQIGDPTM